MPLKAAPASRIDSLGHRPVSRPVRANIVVVTHAGGERLTAHLAGLERFGVTLVDNGARALSVPRASGRLRVVRNEWNEGFARAVNQAAAATDADVLVLVNDDAVVEPHAVDALLDALHNAPSETIAAAGRLTDDSGSRVDFVDGVVTFDGHALQRGAGAPLEDVDPGRRGDLRLFPCGAFCAIKRRDFVELGGFDGDYFAYYEDVDFGWRAALAGRTTILVPEARARHEGGTTGERLGLARRGVLFESNAFFTAYKNLEQKTLDALLPAILATFQHRALRGVVEHQPGAAESLADPFDPRRGPPPPLGSPPPRTRARRLAARLARRDTGPGAPLVLEDEIARMWLVAWNRIVSAWPRLAAQRSEVQARRRVPDRELFARFPLHLIPTYPGDEELFASDFFLQLLPDEPRLVPSTLEEVARGAPAGARR